VTYQQKSKAGTGLELVEQTEVLRLCGHVEGGRWLIRDQKTGLPRESNCAYSPLSHSATQLVRI
jgi:hypothetical protein